MFTQPDDLTDDEVASTLLRGWGIEADAITYAKLGFGSHHWVVAADGGRWFLTVDDLDARQRDESDTRSDSPHRLTSALSTAFALQSGGRGFVVAPTRSLSGSLLEPVSDRYVLALYRHVDGETASWGCYASQAERFDVVDRLVGIHDATSEVSGIVAADDFSIPSRYRLKDALNDTSKRWSTGPYAERARVLLQQNSEAVEVVLDHYDDLVSVVRHRSEPEVVTHGEPHRGNVIFTADGVSLIDWDTVLLAPHERDLWSLMDEDSEVAAYYTRRSGRTIDDNAVGLYRLWWDLCEVSLYMAEFRAPHRETADTQAAWQGLEKYLNPDRWPAHG